MMGSGKWIVMVEDDLDMHYLYKRVFSNLHLQEKLRLFDNAEEALSFLRNSALDTEMIFSDINMPRIDGIELKRKINQDPTMTMPEIPFVLLSTSASETDRRRANGLGIKGLFEKGETLDEIENTVKTVLDSWTSGDATA